MKTFRLVSLAALTLMVACAHQTGRDIASSSDLVQITILHTNDVHGHAWPLQRKDGVVRGGMAAMAALVDRIRQEVEAKKGVTLLLSAGDVNTGVPESDLLKGEPDLRAMSLMKYDAMVVGNHDLDGGMEKLDAQQGWIKFPLLTANVTHAGGSPIRSPFTIVERNNLTFGIIGLTTDTLKNIVLARHVKKLDVLNPVDTARTYLPKLKEKGSDIVIALTHMGISESGKRKNQKIGRDDQQLLKDVPEIDVVIGGHSHTLLPNGLKIDGRLIAQAGEKGEYLGRVDLTWSKAEKRIVEAKATVMPIVPTDGEDPQIKAMLDQQLTRVGKILDEELGVAQTELDGERDHVRRGETNLGNYICDVLRIMTKSQACVFNGGGIRAGIAKGPIRLRDLYRVLPFRNTAVTGTLTGKQIKQALQAGLSNQQASGSLLQVSGLRYCAKDGKLQWVRLGKAILSDGAKVRVVSNNFLFEGGDYMEVLTKAKDIQDTGVPVEDWIAKYMKAHSTVYAKREERILLE